MTRKLPIIGLISFSIILFTACESYLKFEMTRYLSGFFITLIIGVIGLIIMTLKGGKKSNRK